MIKNLLGLCLMIWVFTITSCSESDFLDEVQCTASYLPVDESAIVSRICLGSCASQDKDQPVLYKAVDLNPDLFIYLGDNIYGDTESMDLLGKKYSQLCAKEEFRALRATCPILAVWDDHDYGENDAGLEYPKKEASKSVFMKFWGEEENAERVGHKGIYDSRVFGQGDQTVQIILLDLRTFRTSMNNQPNYDSSATILGAQQWEWLAEQLLEPAQVRIIASSVQFGAEFHGHESWNNFPLEQQRMYDLIESAQASGVVFISGDMHYGELTRLEPNDLYPIYDFTASGITQTYPPEMNMYRIGDPVSENHIGAIDINWNGDSTTIGFSLVDVNGVVGFDHEVALSEISF